MACGDDLHSHRHAEDDDSLRSCDDGAEEEQEHEDEEGRDRQRGEELRQRGDDTGFCQKFFEDHNQQCAEKEFRFESCPDKRYQLTATEVVDENIDQYADPYGAPDWQIKHENQRDRKYNGPDALCEELPVVAFRLIRHHAGILRHTAKIKEPADCEERDDHREHRKDEGTGADTTFGDAEGDKDARVGWHECLRDVTEIRCNTCLLRNTEIRVLHTFADDRSADQHGTCGRQHAEQKWHDRGIDPVIIKEAIHRNLRVAQVFPLFHHAL